MVVVGCTFLCDFATSKFTLDFDSASDLDNCRGIHTKEIIAMVANF